MELKYYKADQRARQRAGSNRTFMELKYYRQYEKLSFSAF